MSDTIHLNETPAKAPDIIMYSRLESYLSDYFKYRKSLDSSFSYEYWSNELGFKSSAIMYLICKGQRTLTTKSAMMLSESLNFTENELQHLLILSSYDQSKSAEVKSALYDKILEKLKYPEMNLEADEYSNFILSPTMPLVRMILSYDDAQGTEEEILSLLKIDAEQLKFDLMQLEEMGLIHKVIVESSRTIWKSTSKSLRIPEENFQSTLSEFYKNNFKEAASAFDDTEIFKKFRSLILAIDPKDYKILEGEVDQFVSKLKNKFAYNTLNNKQLIKIHMQTYQVSETKKISTP